MGHLYDIGADAGETRQVSFCFIGGARAAIVQILRMSVSTVAAAVLPSYSHRALQWPGWCRVNQRCLGKLLSAACTICITERAYARLVLSQARFWLTLAVENRFNRRCDAEYFSSFFAGTPPDVGYPHEPRQITATRAVKF